MDPDRGLYDRAIVSAARRGAEPAVLADAHGSATVDNPLCGDRVSMSLRLEGDRVAAVGHRVRGCLLCEAAAALIAEGAPGWTAGELRAVRGALREALLGSKRFAVPWPSLGIFAPVREARSRHDCVLLPFEALERALDDASR